jgi:hypothetical protein
MGQDQMQRATSQSKGTSRAIAAAGTVALCVLAAACSEPQPRSFADFMEDKMLMDGTLARCNEDRDGTLYDIECANARRAAATIALRVEQERRAELERESERKLEELRTELARREIAAAEALAAAEAAKQAAYEAQWSPDAAGADANAAPPVSAAQEPTVETEPSASAGLEGPRPFRDGATNE